MSNNNIVLKFKNVGKYADEDSSRYEAVVNDNVKVRIWRDGYMEKGFVFSFLTSEGYDMDNITGDFRSTFWSRASKKDCVKRVTEIVNDEECVSKLDKYAVYWNARMAEYKESRLKNG